MKLFDKQTRHDARRNAIHQRGFVKCPCCGMHNTIHTHDTICCICGRWFKYDMDADSPHQPMKRQPKQEGFL